MEIRVKKKYEAARSNLLLVIIFTAINLLLILLDSGITFLFSASVPQIFAVMGMYLDALAETSFFTGIGIMLALINLGVYLLCWFCSKKRSGWMIFAFVWFILDWVGMIFGVLFLFELDASMLLDLAFHIWITIYLISGLKYGKEYCTHALYEKKLSDFESAEISGNSEE